MAGAQSEERVALALLANGEVRLGRADGWYAGGELGDRFAAPLLAAGSLVEGFAATTRGQCAAASDLYGVAGCGEVFRFNQT